MRKLKVAIIFGGKSAEHEVSLQSARNVIDALDRDRYEPVLIGIDKEGRWLLGDRSGFLLDADDPSRIALAASGDEVTFAPESGGRLVPVAARPAVPGPAPAGPALAGAAIDVAFPILHGPLGEDGTAQGFLRLAGIPFVGAGVLGSAVGMDKDVMKRLLRDAGIPVADFLALRKHDPEPAWESVAERLGPVVFVKPANMGSSVGVSKVRSAAEFGDALEGAFRWDRKVLVEEFIEGRELECAVLGNEAPEASVVGEIRANADFYSYAAKYLDENGAALEIPAGLPEDVARRARELALRTFRVLECEGLARVDMFLRPDGGLVVNEINTMPGFTRISMYPKLWEASGVPYPELVDRLIALALERAERERALSTSR
ncbi:MAG TPA: D-alanine--D-alanine ligase [Spirochaetales bacterium]|nr:D-alanine--D-alanine ligase [Spirochaetales bacterium]